MNWFVRHPEVTRYILEHEKHNDEDEVRQIAEDSAHRHMAVLAEIEEGLPIPVIPCEDEPMHTEDHPFCGDMECPCRNEEAFDALIKRPMIDGLMTSAEGMNLYWSDNI